LLYLWNGLASDSQRFLRESGMKARTRWFIVELLAVIAIIGVLGALLLGGWKVTRIHRLRNANIRQLAADLPAPAR
jgi:hypothetical protein